MSERFRFTVEKITEGWSDDSDGLVTIDPPEWTVSLPHQCDAWEIVGNDDSGQLGGVSQAEAIAELERFLAEGQDALDRLRDGEVTP